MAQTRFAQTVRPFASNADLPGLRVATLPARASPPAILSGLVAADGWRVCGVAAGGGRFCRVVAGMGRVCSVLGWWKEE